jgi:hypothetical protein
MKNRNYKISEKVWVYPGKGGWHFVTITKEDADAIRDNYIWPRAGFGSIPVNVTIGKTKWKTSIFPEKKGTFVLPLKRSVRDAEGISEGDSPKILLELLN